MSCNWTSTRLLTATFVFICIHGACASDLSTTEEDRATVIAKDINELFARKLDLYRSSLPGQLQAQAAAGAIVQHLSPTLVFLYDDIWRHVKQDGFVVPELGSVFEDEVAALFGNITYAKQHSKEVSPELVFHFLLATLSTFNPSVTMSLWTAYPISRRAVMAILLERYLQTGNFTASEAKLVLDISQRLFQLHKQAAQTKRIVEFFHVSKSGGTSFCQLGRLNGCKTEDFGHRQNCMITYFRDAPRWTKPGVLGELSQQHGDPWCARYGRQYSFRWHCRARRQLMMRLRYNFYSNELVMHDHNRSWWGVHPCREFLNVVIFREPETRVMSHLQNILKEYVAHYNSSFWSAFDPTSPDRWRTLAPPVFDNYVVRSLLGGQAYNMPYGAVHPTHLLAAKIVTLQFEVLLSLTPQTSELTRDIFGLGLGWHFDLRHLHARPTEHRAVSEFGPAVRQAVLAGQKYDNQLYEFALVLQLLDALAFGVARDVGGVGVAGGVDSAVGARGAAADIAAAAASAAAVVGAAAAGHHSAAVAELGGPRTGGSSVANSSMSGSSSTSDTGRSGDSSGNNNTGSTSSSNNNSLRNLLDLYPSSATTLTGPANAAAAGKGGGAGAGLQKFRGRQKFKTAKANRRCGYVGIRRPPVAVVIPAGEPAPPVVVPGLDVVGLGGSLIQGGRWFNGTFYKNASTAAEAAVAAAEAARAAAEAQALAFATAAAAAGAGAG